MIDAFLDKKKADGTKLTTDGTTLDGQWMGGTGIATWEKGKIAFHDLGSKAAQTVQKAIKKKAPKNWLAEAKYKSGPGFLAWNAGVSAKNLADELKDVAKAMKKGGEGKAEDYGNAADRLEELKKEIDRCVPALRKAAK